MKKVYAAFGITHFTSPIKSFPAERCVRHLKSKLFRAMKSRNSLSWIDILQDVAKTMNHTFNRVIGTKPSLVTRQNERFIFRNAYNSVLPKSSSPRFKKGSLVRITLAALSLFEKESHSNRSAVSEELFIVNKVIRSKIGVPAVYNLIDLKLQEIKSIFYGPELFNVTLKSPDRRKFVSLVSWNQEGEEGSVIFKLKYKGTKRDHFVFANEKEIYKLASQDE